MKRAVLACLIASCVALAGCSKPFEPAEGDERTFQWPKAALKLAGTIPLQDGGRVKPLSTYAGFQLLKINGKRKIKVKSGETLKPTAWLLDCMFFPGQAETYDCFRIDDTDVLVRIGLKPRAKNNGLTEKRGNYSFAYIQGGVTKLFELARVNQQKSKLHGAESLDSLDRQVIELAGKVNQFHSLLQTMHFARAHYHVRDSGSLKLIFKGEGKEGRLSEILTNADGMFQIFKELRSPDAEAKIPKARREAELDSIGALFTAAKEGAEGSARLAFFPPSDPKELTWLSVGDLFRARFGAALEGGENAHAAQVKTLALFEELEANKGDSEAFTSALETYHNDVKGQASARGAWWKIPLEVHYYGADWFYRALIVYMLAFFVVAATWFFPKNTRLYWGAWALLGLATILIVVGITERCVIRSRPPVSTLYETILFITATSALVALGIEWINRQRIALSVTPILGAMGMFLAMRYEFREAVTAGDTMGSLVAVLDTNFWLATHVTSVTLGYSAGLLAAAIAHLWLITKAIGVGDRSFHKTIARMAYGVLCFGLLFSVVGTILGGIWANDSWGRFWGWDPKENGALLIVLWEIAILHARMGGYIRDLGLCIATVLGGCVVAFSWWGVNLLNVGLHSYGFTEGAGALLNTFYGAELLFVVVTGVAIAARASAGGASPSPSA
ncbi:MAG: cytochrome c biogenesis protein CcsA [Planctomycetes bacterium]|nr:cytochrome c biogenesis protein CcsA [Planctomycetota bacterium]